MAVFYFLWLFLYQQLKGHLHTLDELRQQVKHSDLTSFDHLTDGLRRDILTAVRDYQTLTTSSDSKSQGGVGVAAVGVARESSEEEEEEGEEEGGERQMLQRAALHCQSLEDLRAVSQKFLSCFLPFLMLSPSPSPFSISPMV